MKIRRVLIKHTHLFIPHYVQTMITEELYNPPVESQF